MADSSATQVGKKRWFQSKTILWSIGLILVNAYRQIAQLEGVPLPDISDEVVGLISAVAGVGAIHGRVVAKTQIAKKE
ncbi:MAG: hypothetical protein OXC09_08635 [Truepera sp.]|nr:hypothetical protein [Truepera sp.]